jgi:signal transduction histidine kinase
MEMGAVFGSHVALALELSRVHRLREELLVFTDRDRIARDLHDLVIQRLFAAGLSVQSLTAVHQGRHGVGAHPHHHRVSSTRRSAACATPFTR